MSDSHHYYPSSSSRNIPRSSYSSLANAVTGYPTSTQPHSTTPYYGAPPQHHQNQAPHGYGMAAPPPSSAAPVHYNAAAQYAGNTMAQHYSNTNMQHPGVAANHFPPAIAQNAPNYPYPGNPQNSGFPEQYMPGPDPSGAIKQCDHCHTTSTPLWRRDPSAPHRILCNACGLFKQQRHAERPKILIDADDDGAAEGSASPPPGSPECSHCHATTTSVWRRNKDGERVCNACGCWQRLHNGAERPLSMKRNKVKPRARPQQM